MNGEGLFALGLGFGVFLGIAIDRAVIPLGERLGDLLAVARHRHRSRDR